MTQKELDDKILFERAIPSISTYKLLKDFVSQIADKSITEAKQMVLDRASEVINYWNDDKIKEYIDIDGSPDTYACSEELGYIIIMLKTGIIDDISQLLTICMVVDAFRYHTGVTIKPHLAYVIWSYFVCEHYAAQWIDCGSDDECWKDILIGFLFEDWDNY